MRTYFRTTELPKRLARAIVHVFPALALSAGQEWAARMCGYRNWHELDMFARNYSGEVTPDPFLADYIANEEALGPRHDDASVKAKSARVEYQCKVLDELMALTNSTFRWADHYWQIMDYAHRGLSGLDRVRFGRGAPLFEALQFPWFELEDQAAHVFEEGELDVDFTTEPFVLMNGFSSHQQLNRWLKGATRLSNEDLSEMKSEFPGLFPRVGGGSDIRLARDTSGGDVAVQSMRHRYWWQRNRDHRMLGGFSLTVRVNGAREDSVGDEFEACIHDTWYAPSAPMSLVEADFPRVPWADVIGSLARFLQTRVGMSALHGKVTVAYDSNAGSRRLAETLRDLAFDMTRDATQIDLDQILHHDVVPYQPRYLRRNGFSHLPSELV